MALSLWWGRLFGLFGIAYATVVAFMVDRIILVGYNWVKLNIPIYKYVDIKSYVFYNVCLVIGFIISLQY